MWLGLDFYRKGGCLLDVVEETIVRWNDVEISIQSELAQLNEFFIFSRYPYFYSQILTSFPLANYNVFQLSFP